jgi:hypothetical protein
MAVDTFFVVAVDGIVLRIIVVGLIGALVHANLASDAAVVISLYDVFCF